MFNRSKIFDYADKKFGIKPEYPFEKYPHYAVLRHSENNKWFGLVMDVSKDKLNLDGDGKVDVIDIKCHLHMIDDLESMAGFRPAYHMNKEHWLTVVLDGSVSQKKVFELLDESYALTR